MKTLAIRRWLLLAWLSTLIVGNGLFSIAEYGTRRYEAHHQQVMHLLYKEVVANEAHWFEPNWQQALRTQLATWDGALELRDGAGQVQFVSARMTPNAQPVQTIIALDGVQVIGTFKLFAPLTDQLWTWMRLGLVLFLFLLPSVVVGWFLGRMVLQPLAAMSRAARQIAGGTLAFDLPPSRVQEVAEVSTAFHAMGDALRAALERQAELEQERRLFISAIAHDLRTPLFSLRGYLEGLATGVAATAEKRAHYLAVCQEQATVLEQRIAALFAYTRLEYLEQRPRFERLDLSALVQQISARFRPLLNDKQVILQTSGPDALAVAGDSQLLTRVLENLLDNALRYTPSGGTIHVTWYQAPNRIYFTVADTGPGVAPDALPYLFTPLAGDDPDPQRRPNGAGLGLTIAQRILQAHGGGLTVTNHATGGAAFVGWLPV